MTSAALLPSWLGWLALLSVGASAAWGIAELRERNQYSAHCGYRDTPTRKGWGAIARFAHRMLAGQRIAVHGDSRFFPLYGDRYTNSVVQMLEERDAKAVLRRCRAEGATVLVCFNTVEWARRSSLRANNRKFQKSLGSEIITRYPGAVRVLFEAQDAYVLQLLPPEDIVTAQRQ